MYNSMTTGQKLKSTEEDHVIQSKGPEKPLNGPPGENSAF